MQRVTRSNIDNTLVQVEDPEQILRERCRSMAEQGREVPRETRDSDGKEYTKLRRWTPLSSMYQTWTTHLCRELSEMGWHWMTARPSTGYAAQTQEVHRDGHPVSHTPRRMTGSAHGPTSRLRGKLRSHSVWPTKTPSGSYAKSRHHTTGAGHTPRWWRSLDQRQVSDTL